MSIPTLSAYSAAVILAAALLCSCASGTFVPLPDEIREARGLKVGVVSGRVCPPDMRIMGVPARGMGPSGTDSLILGRRDERRWGTRHPILLADERRLEQYLRTRKTDQLEELRGFVAGELAARGWKAVDLDARVIQEDLPDFEGNGNGYAQKDYRGVAQGHDLDALVVIDCRFRGVYCHYTGYYHQDFTDAGARLEGTMVSLHTNEVLWRSTGVEVRNPVSCRCNEPVDFPCIDSSVRSALADAAAALVRDLLGP